MRNSRLIRKRGPRKKISNFEIDITSLLDILVILLVFLLKSYNSSGIIFNVPKDIKLPESISQNPSSAGVIVQVSPQKILVDDKLVLDVGKVKGSFMDYRRQKIIPLYNELVRKKEVIKATKAQVKGAKPFTGTINLIVDKSIKYSFVKKLMNTAAEAGYAKFKFVVMGEN